MPPSTATAEPRTPFAAQLPTVAGHVREDGAVAGRTAAESADIAGEPEHRGGDQRLAGGTAGVAEDIGDGEAVGAVEDEISGRDQVGRLGDGQAPGQASTEIAGLAASSASRAASAFVATEVGHAIERLAVEVGLLDPVMVEHGQLADAGAGQRGQHGRAQAPGADHQHSGRGEPGLAGGTDLGQDRLAGVAVGHGASTASRHSRDAGLRAGVA